MPSSINGLNIKNLIPTDIPEIRKIHEKYFKDEFKFPDFLKGYVNAFVIQDDDGSIIVAGGVRPIMESILITDLSCTPRERYEGLRLALNASQVACERINHFQLHAFVQDDLWIHHLEKYGFKDTKGKSLVISW